MYVATIFFCHNLVPENATVYFVDVVGAALCT